jgi:hypothetical protein
MTVRYVEVIFKVFNLDNMYLSNKFFTDEMKYGNSSNSNRTVGLRIRASAIVKYALGVLIEASCSVRDCKRKREG